MSFLLDTCVVSELFRSVPESRVVEWYEATAPRALFVSALTLGEIRKGVEKLGSGPRRDRIRAWLEIEFPGWFDGRILPVDAAVADEWGRLAARAARTLPMVDSLIAATALCHRLSVATRNVADFAPTGVAIVNPWAMN